MRAFAFVIVNILMSHSDIQTTMNIYTDLKGLGKMSISEEYKQKLQTTLKIQI